MEGFVQGILQLLPALLLVVVAAAVLGIAVVVARSRRGPRGASVRVIGVGGAGGNAVERMIQARTAGVDFIVCNTDAQALLRSAAPRKIQIGDTLTSGLGVGGDPALGRKAAEDDAERIAAALMGSDIVFVTAGMGGGTGSGAAPVVAGLAREQGALTIGVVTLPFSFEGSRRQDVAREAVEELTSQVDALITVPNDGVHLVALATTTMLEAFRTVDDVLRQGIQGILDVMTVPGLVNLDLADLKAILKDAGPALLGIGRGTGEDRAADAAREAIYNPLLGVDIRGARRILFNVTGSADLSLSDVTRAAEVIRGAADPDANVIFGATFDERVGDEVRITVIATGLDGTTVPAAGRVAAHSAGKAAPEAARNALIETGAAAAPPHAAAPPSAAAPLTASTPRLATAQRLEAPTRRAGPTREPKRRKEPDPLPVTATTNGRHSEGAGAHAERAEGDEAPTKPVATPGPLASEPEREASPDLLPDDLDVPAFLRRHRPHVVAARSSTGPTSD